MASKQQIETDDSDELVDWVRPPRSKWSDGLDDLQYRVLMDKALDYVREREKRGTQGEAKRLDKKRLRKLALDLELLFNWDSHLQALKKSSLAVNDSSFTPSPHFPPPVLESNAVATFYWKKACHFIRVSHSHLFKTKS